MRFGAYPLERLRGTVQFIGDVLAPETRTVKVRIALANPAHRFKPGMFARVAVRGEEDALYVEKATGRLERRAVLLGDLLPAGVEITSGFEAGERVVTSNTILIP